MTDVISLMKRWSNGTVIPKPEAVGVFKVKGWGKRRGEDALIYLIPNQNGGKPYQKGITVSEFRAAYKQLSNTGTLTCEWFKDKLPECYREGSCNFTTVGGLFELAGLAARGERGEYVRTA